MTEQANLTSAALIKDAIESAKDTRVKGEAIPSANQPSPDRAEPSEQPETVSNTGVSTWRDTLPEELRNTPSLAKFKDVESLAKSYLEGEKTFSSRVAIPKEDAPDTDWEAFYKKVGRPEDKRYVPDEERIADEEALLAAYEGMLYDSGLNLRQGRQVFAKMRELSAKMGEEAAKARESERQENLKALEQAFGDKMDLKVNQIKAALGKFGGDASSRDPSLGDSSLSQGLAALVEQTNYNPYLVQFLSSVGEAMASDRLVTGDTAPLSPMSQEAALAEISNSRG